MSRYWNYPLINTKLKQWLYKIRIYHEFVDRIGNSVPRSLFGITRLRRTIPNSDLRDKVVYHFHKIILDSSGCQCLIEFTSAILKKTKVNLTLLCRRLTTNLRDILYNQQDVGLGEITWVI